MGCSQADVTATSRKRDYDQSFRLTQPSLTQLRAANSSLYAAIQEARTSPADNAFIRAAVKYGIEPFSVTLKSASLVSGFQFRNHLSLHPQSLPIKSESDLLLQFIVLQFRKLGHGFFTLTFTDGTSSGSGDNQGGQPTSEKSKTGAIVGGVVGGLLLIVAAVLAILLMKKKEKRDVDERSVPSGDAEEEEREEMQGKETEIDYAASIPYPRIKRGEEETQREDRESEKAQEQTRYTIAVSDCRSATFTPSPPTETSSPTPSQTSTVTSSPAPASASIATAAVPAASSQTAPPAKSPIKSKKEREEALRAKAEELRQEIERRAADMDELLLEEQTEEVEEKQRQLEEENAQLRKHIEAIEKRIYQLVESTQTHP
ncbi:hypothetical protein PROFUN_11611 [Planoprotostelium fungivorum]|uniref:Uncharacterized protein n=1 Tax=Planoprotostelium fungivorum TaxID=1890364 RepID=A0A2P6N2C2_9EUKA|nr:hypothetical protein PROFUN_11611 [Planoprotostelium fungivorum]